MLCLFTGRCLSLYLLTHSGTGSFLEIRHSNRHPDRSEVKINDPQPKRIAPHAEQQPNDSVFPCEVIVC